MRLIILIFLLFIIKYSSGQQRHDRFIELVVSPSSNSLKTIQQNWASEDIITAIETAYLIRNPITTGQLLKIMESKTGQNFGTDFNKWYSWYWQQGLALPEDYLEFKADLYNIIDPHFQTYFQGRQDQILIDPTEIRWGGVKQNGIPPLKFPDMIPTQKAVYLEPDNTVFGIMINGQARAYPKRILAWHEFFIDSIGGVNVAGVYCTLCGTVIAYDAQDHILGTSGFLYKSNKLMFDEKTQSLWSTFEGKPVLGPLVKDSIELSYFPVVTTTWKDWKELHPNSLVLSPQTGYQRNYAEGAAYTEYFASDELMFEVKNRDNRLKNKTEVLVIRQNNSSTAISTKFLKKHRVYMDSINNLQYVVITEKTGANRVYAINNQKFLMKKRQLLDHAGKEWQMTEKYLTDGKTQLPRLPTFRAFWFGWYAAHPDTRLIK